MAKPNIELTIGDWIWLFDALQEATNVLGSQALAKGLLVEWLATGKLPWTCTLFVELDEQGLATARRANESLGSILSALIWFSAPSLWINWKDNSAGENRNCALGIKVSREHLRTLLRPEEPREGEEVGAGAWIAAEAKRMKAANEIPPDMKITDFARELERRMGEAAANNKSLRPIKLRTIRNQLRMWGVWPITSIK